MSNSLLTPEWLTNTLRANGLLAQGHVVAVQAQAVKSNTAQAQALTVTYSDDVSVSAPRQLFLKLSRRKPEYDFYTTLMPTMVKPPVLPCYAATYDPHAEAVYLLFEDVSVTHRELGKPASVEQCTQYIDALA